MEQPSDQNLRHIKTAIIGLFIALLFSVSGLAVLTKNNSEQLQEKDLKISVLIDEVGTLREDMDNKQATFRALLKELSSVNKELAALSTSGTTGSTAEWKKVSIELAAKQKKMASMLSEKENIINDLAQKNLNLKSEQSIPQYSEDIINILILGQNSGLMDSIILANINPETQKITMLSVPRDLSYKGRKINELYSKYGIEKLEDAIQDVTGVHPDKYVVFNFESFVDVIDMLGGVDVNVAKSFTDNSYPGVNHSYTTVSFKAGDQHMDGAKALKYARSRKSTSDFDRSKRQQGILDAVKEKVHEVGLVSQIDLALKIYGKIQNKVSTDINLFEGLSYVQKYEEYAVVNNNVLDTNNYLYSTKNERGQYILLPKSQSFTAIKEFAYELING